MRSLSSAKRRSGSPIVADDSGLQVLAAANKIENLVRDRIEHHPIDGEIAALHIFARILAEAHLVRMTAVGVAHIGAKGRDLDGAPWLGSCREGLARPRAVAGRSPCSSRNQHDPKLLAHRKRLRKDLHHLLRSSVGSDVIVGRLATKQQIAHASADEVCLVARAPAACGRSRWRVVWQ